jgi:hypothetical protein
MAKERRQNRSSRDSEDDQNRRAAMAEVQAIYNELDERPIERSCITRTECCQFRLTGQTPMLTAGEALVLAKGWRASGRKTIEQPSGGECPVLNLATGKCRAYETRPFGCRTHFCRAAGGPYSRASVLDLIRRLESIDEDLGGDGPHPLPTALTRALAREG